MVTLRGSFGWMGPEREPIVLSLAGRSQSQGR
jgi:hypothetical protein